MAKNNDLGFFLKSINKTKKNVIRESETPDLTKKSYVPFITNRVLSYHLDCVLYCNILNTMGISVPNDMHYEFLLYAIDKGNRFDKMRKPEKDGDVESVAKYYACSQRQAREFIDLIDDETLKHISKMNSPEALGGIQ